MTPTSEKREFLDSQYNSRNFIAEYEKQLYKQYEWLQQPRNNESQFSCSKF